MTTILDPQTPTLMGGTPSGAAAGTTVGLPLNAAGTAVLFEGSGGTAPSGSATAALQTTGNTSLATIATASASQATAANQTTGNTSLSTIATNTGKSSSTHAGANISLSDTASHQGASQACTFGCYVSAPIANTAPIYVGFATGVTTGTGIELNPGDREYFRVANTNQIWAITGTATQACHVLAD